MLAQKQKEIFDRALLPHPLSFGIHANNVEPMMREFLAMSLLFPFVQAAAHERIVMDCLEAGVPVPSAVEATAVVGAFLCWDEFGGHHKMKTQGAAGLPSILKTSHFHSNLLKADMEQLFGAPVEYRFSEVTRVFMQRLREGLGAREHARRVAYMVAFEFNAEVMLKSLYHSLKALFPEKASHLLYFEIHVGGDDPAETYHKQMTERLIQAAVGELERENYLAEFDKACGEMRDWMSAIKRTAADERLHA